MGLKEGIEMYPILHDIFKDKKGGEVFNCFEFWHFFYVFLVIAVIAVAAVIFLKKDGCIRERVLKAFVACAFGLYMADFFLMPFAYGEIDVDKLPFHSCTMMCIMCFLSRNWQPLRKYRVHFAMFGGICNLMYIAYPAGVMWYEIHPLSYRAVQTLLFHSIMVMYGVLTLILDDEKPQIKYCYRDIVILCIMTVWAMLGNAFYSGAADGYDHDFNWFFIKADPFGLVPEGIARYVVPWLNLAAFYLIEMLIYLAFVIIKRKSQTARVENTEIVAEAKGESYAYKG